MHFQKLYAVICVAALVGAISLNVQGADSDAQAKARELLRQKLAELDGKSGANAAIPAPVAPTPPPPVILVQPVPVNPAPAVTAAPVSGKLSPEDIEKAREAMRQKMAELNGQPVVKGGNSLPAQPIQPIQPVPINPEPAVTAAPAPGRLSPEEVEKAREALRQKMAELNGTPGQSTIPDAVAPKVGVKEFQDTGKLPPAAVVVEPDAVRRSNRLTPEQAEQAREAVRLEKAKLDANDQALAETAAKQKAEAALVAQQKAGATAVAVAKPTAVPAEAANPALSSKEQKLQDLLQQYKADKITPAEYHQRRAQIISE
ncbi:MAG: hypothetical protein JWQ04_2596 [Pedosphaera sp.]|nr:hypothetical protein [Pedosphaera sp.]